MADEKEYTKDGREIIDNGKKWSTGEKILGALMGPLGAVLTGGSLPSIFSGGDSKYKRKPTYGPMPSSTGGSTTKAPGMAKGGQVGRPKKLKGNMPGMDMKAPVKKPMKAMKGKKPVFIKGQKPMFAKGGSVKASRGDGCAVRGKTKGRMC